MKRNVLLVVMLVVVIMSLLPMSASADFLNPDANYKMSLYTESFDGINIKRVYKVAGERDEAYVFIQVPYIVIENIGKNVEEVTLQEVKNEMYAIYTFLDLDDRLKELNNGYSSFFYNAELNVDPSYARTFDESMEEAKKYAEGKVEEFKALPKETVKEMFPENDFDFIDYDTLNEEVMTSDVPYAEDREIVEPMDVQQEKQKESGETDWGMIVGISVAVLFFIIILFVLFKRR